MIKREGGFSMVEALISLGGYLMIISVSLIMLKPVYEIAEREKFFNLLKADLYYAQVYAISRQRDITVSIMGEDNRYYIHDRYGMPLLADRVYPPAIKVAPGSMPLFFKFQPSGNVSRFGSFIIDTYEDRYRMTIQIGKGRFYVAEE
jgi:competence protein ComGD